MNHQYAAHGDSMPGALTEHGSTAQSIRVVPEAIFVQPEILASENVGKPVVKRADRRPSSRAKKRP